MKSFAFCGIGKVGGQDGRRGERGTHYVQQRSIPRSRWSHSIEHTRSDFVLKTRRGGREEGTGRETSEDAVGVLQNFYDMDAHRPRSAII